MAPCLWVLDVFTHPLPTRRSGAPWVPGRQRNTQCLTPAALGKYLQREERVRTALPPLSLSPPKAATLIVLWLSRRWLSGSLLWARWPKGKDPFLSPRRLGMRLPSAELAKGCHLMGHKRGADPVQRDYTQ